SQTPSSTRLASPTRPLDRALVDGPDSARSVWTRVAPLPPQESIQAGERRLSALAREDRRRQRRHEQNPRAEGDHHRDRLKRVYAVFCLRDCRRARAYVAKDEALADHQERHRDNRNERVLDERLEPAPEQPIELRDDEEWNEKGAEKRTDSAGNQTKRDDGHRHGLRTGDQEQHHPIDEIGQDSERARL